jgi:hypothetical protein
MNLDGGVAGNCSLILPAKPGGCNSSFLGSDGKEHELHKRGPRSACLDCFFDDCCSRWEKAGYAAVFCLWNNCHALEKLLKREEKRCRGEMPVKLIATINDAGATSGLRSGGSCGC